MSNKYCNLQDECKIVKELQNKIKEEKNVLSISHNLWMYHIANCVGNSDNKSAT